MSHDAINGLFETVAAGFQFLNVLRLQQDKDLKGVDWKSVAFFFAMGVWNLWFYPAAGLYWSFCGGVLICLVNLTWLSLAGYYWLQRRAVRLNLQPMPAAETGVQS